MLVLFRISTIENNKIGILTISLNDSFIIFKDAKM